MVFMNNSMDLSEGPKSNGGGGGIPFPPPNFNQNSNNDSPHSSGGAEPVIKRVRIAFWTRFFLFANVLWVCV